MRKPKFTHTCIDERSEEPQVVGEFWLTHFGINYLFQEKIQPVFFWCKLFLQNCVEPYLPTQKFAKIFPKISSGVVSPVISERKDNASSKS